MFSTAFLLVFQAALIAQIGRIERGRPKVWTYAALMAGAGNVVSFTFPLMFWTAALFRAERPPEILALANDMAWLPFLGMVSPFVPRPFCVAIAGLSDEAADPVFPRWVAHFNIAIAALMIPSAFSLLCKTGPLAWDGSLSFTLRLGTYAVYVAVMFLVLLRVVSRQHEDAELIA